MDYGDAHVTLLLGKNIGYTAPNGNRYRLRPNSDSESDAVWCERFNKGQEGRKPDAATFAPSKKQALRWASSIAPLAEWQEEP